MKNRTMKVWLEPGIDAVLRRFCEENELSLNTVIRYSIGAFCHDLKPGADLPTQRSIYGKLSKQAITVRFNSSERKFLERLAGQCQLRRERSFSVFVRHALNCACRQISCGVETHPEQSQEPASEDSLPHPAS